MSPTDSIDSPPAQGEAATRAPSMAARTDGVTPMMVQFMEIKSAHPDYILFYRMGDF